MTINCKGNLIDLTVPKIMGILNVTPDSFYDGGVYKSDLDVLNQVEFMLKEGATFIDIGAYSSRPQAKDISEDEELKRILPVIESCLKQFPKALISVDTFRSRIAKLGIDAGAALINDISAGHLDDNMIKIVGQLGVPYIMMHMKGTPQTMQEHIQYKDMIREMIYYFSKQIQKAIQHQIKDIIIDPGFGFSKTLEQNYNILKNLDAFNILDRPILAGLSRKSMVYKPLKTNAQLALNGTTSLHSLALIKSASILRVHDVKEAMECITLNQYMKS